MLALIAAAALAWLGLLLAAPFLPPPVSAALYLSGSFICHQRPERSFHLDGAQLPVCARCLGIYAGAAFGAMAAPVIGQVRRARMLIVIALVPALASLVVEWAGWSPLSNTIRAVTGVMAGAVVAAVVLATLHYEQCAPRPPIAPPPPQTPI
ncbi:MAG TPA: DUF2085 domain-containing protein [Vicinamibacterales bacterium]|nr:DUF2085 domain-containing protein [Vicinamibacterales bacterium]